MGVLQIDSISVVARSPYLVLWSRLGPYDPIWLDELLAEGCLFEGWSHAACFVPIEDYGLYRRSMLDGGEESRASFSAHPGEVRRVLERGRRGGPGGSAGFARARSEEGRGGEEWRVRWAPS